MEHSLSHYISELLYRYDCVIIPDFGGFVTNVQTARIDKQSYSIHPPSKQISFNSRLDQNDGILVNFIAESNDLSYTEAKEQIAEAVADWNSILKFEALHLPKIGRIEMGSEDQLLFEPENSTNFLTDSFGLSTVRAKEVEKVTAIKQEKAKKNSVRSLENKRQSYLKYAAIFVVGISLIALGGIEVNKNYQSALGTQKVQEDQIKSSKIETATFQIDQSLPTLKVNLQEKKVEKTPVEVIAVNKPFHVIAGAFRDQKNAQKKVNDLLAKGYKAELLGVNKWNLHQVSFGAFETRLQADQTLKQVRKSGTPDAWVLKSK
ncbi:MAG: SPOR domain-containing protein [Flavobacteriaceae bacterium]